MFPFLFVFIGCGFIKKLRLLVGNVRVPTQASLTKIGVFLERSWVVSQNLS